jgi:hypothetical protein
MGSETEFFRKVLEKNTWYGLETLFGSVIGLTDGDSFSSDVPIFGKIEQWTLSDTPTNHRHVKQQIVFFPVFGDGNYFRLPFYPENEIGLRRPDAAGFLEFFNRYLCPVCSGGKDGAKYKRFQNSCIGPFRHYGPRERIRHIARYDLFTVDFRDFHFKLLDKFGLKIVADKSGEGFNSAIGASRNVFPSDQTFKNVDFPFALGETNLYLTGLNQNTVEYITDEGIRVHDSRHADHSEAALIAALDRAIRKKLEDNISSSRAGEIRKIHILLGEIVINARNSECRWNEREAARFLDMLEEITGQAHLPCEDILGNTLFEKRAVFKNFLLPREFTEKPFPRVDYFNPYRIVVK